MPLQNKIEVLLAEIEQLKKINMATLCAFCGEIFEADADADGRKIEALKEHMMKCDKHPMTALRRRAEEAEAKIEKALKIYDDAKRKYNSDQMHKWGSKWNSV